MARPLRIEYDGAVYYITSRGKESWLPGKRKRAGLVNLHNN
jgi:hypothetical protein